MKNKIYGILLFVISIWGIKNNIQKKYYCEQIIAYDNRINKYTLYYKILNNWMIIKEEHKDVESYFIKHGYQRIAVYGLGILSERLIKSLENSSVQVLYAIDKAADKKQLKIPVYFPEMVLPDVEVIVITINDFNTIEDKLKKLTNIPIISLEQLIEEIKTGDYHVS